MKKRTSLLFLPLLFWLFSGCHPHVNTPAKRQWYAFHTKYNNLYHINLLFNKTLEELQKAGDTIHASPKPYDPVIEKCEQTIQTYSISRKPPRKRGWRSDPAQRALQEKKEYNPALVDCWRLLALSHFYNTDFQRALDILLYMEYLYQDKELVKETSMLKRDCLEGMYEKDKRSFILQHAKKQKNTIIHSFGDKPVKETDENDSTRLSYKEFIAANQRDSFNRYRHLTPLLVPTKKKEEEKNPLTLFSIRTDTTIYALLLLNEAIPDKNLFFFEIATFHLSRLRAKHIELELTERWVAIKGFDDMNEFEWYKKWLLSQPDTPEFLPEIPCIPVSIINYQIITKYNLIEEYLQLIRNKPICISG